MSGRPTNPALRFWAKVDKGEGCWNWNAYARNGYGRFRYGGRVEQAHHVAWMMSGGRRLVADEVLDHLCHNSLCVRPDHLAVTSMIDNSRRGRRSDVPVRASWPAPETFAERFWSKVDKVGECWQWTAATFTNGYGMFSIRGRATRAHRVAWFIEHGSEPVGVLDHRCRNRACVNPAHLEDVDARTNVRRGSAVNFRDQCGAGHPMSGENLYFDPYGHRSCKACNRDQQRARKRAISNSQLTLRGTA